MLKQAFILLIVSLIFSLGVNLVSPNKIPYIGSYRELSSGDGPIVPPTAEEGDPPFIAIDVAEMEHSMGKAMFVDARDDIEFYCGTIPGSVNIPFDYLPEENTDQYIDSMMNNVSKDTPIIVFCSGEECDLSLHLARNMQYYGYTNLSIFFGGAREWENFNLELQRSPECEE
ncbi:MAG: rhodanese-like domain-containing protein [Calditrichaeota bacterium]|nr:MAG: rhodanese-like domain-containing protein [Calditrichota bacterium]